jgi:hypothetical protein
MTRAELYRLSLGQLHAHLLTLRESLLGPDMQGYAECPHCGERLEFNLAVEAIRAETPAVPRRQEYKLAVEGYELRFRLLNSLDLKAAAEVADQAAIRRHLVERCVLSVRQQADEIAVAGLPESVIANLAERLSEDDPDAEVLLDLQCPSCRHDWQLSFDIVGFFWTELSVLARRLLGEVHIIASAYGWTEAEILGLNARRRHYYLELIGG